MSLIRCSRCGGSVYEYGKPTQGLERVVSRVTGCTTYSCYGCGRQGWQRKGHSTPGIAVLAKAVQVLIPLLAILIILVVFLRVFVR